MRTKKPKRVKGVYVEACGFCPDCGAPVINYWTRNSQVCGKCECQLIWPKIKKEWKKVKRRDL